MPDILPVDPDEAKRRQEARARLGKKLHALRKELDNFTSTTGTVDVNCLGGACEYGMNADDYKLLRQGLREADSGIDAALQAVFDGCED